MTEIDNTSSEEILANLPIDNGFETVITTLEKKGDLEEHDELLEVIEEEKKDTTDYSGFTKNDFVEKAQSLVNTTNIKEGHDVFKKIRILFDDMVKAERMVQIKEWADAGNEVREFKSPYDEQKELFYKAYTVFLEKRADEKKMAEVEKQKNLNAKKAILEKLKTLASNDETEKVFTQVLDLQKEWKQIRTVPREHMQELWDSYRFYLEKFYDNHTINNELKELDRHKNLETKIELLKKVSLLHDEKSVKKAYILLNKYHEDFKNAGPVTSKEASEDIWKRFKESTDAVLEEKRAQLEVIKAKRNDNLELKKVLCEKIELLAQINYESAKIWKEKSEETTAIFAEWKAIGPVPESMNDQIWKRFRDAQNHFNINRKHFFDKLNSGKDENLKAKIALCEQAEKIAEGNQFDVAGKLLISLQEKWRSIGPVPDNMNDKVWGRFRKACDGFFAKRDEYYKERNQGEKENLITKENIIKEIEALVNTEDGTAAFTSLRKLQQQWMTIGFVPMKSKNDLQTNYNKVIDAVYKKFKQSADENKQLRMKEHYELLYTAPNGEDKLKYEERNINDKLKGLKDEAVTLNNNIEFFAKSKNADALRGQIEQKVTLINSQIAKLQEELKVLRSFKNANAR
ncbi:MAG: DUF349 domain-containing protein [Bacteroidetes bacterium]|nr:DUF349 domain-containing protein [Bacteroidota bacterium]